MKQSQKNTFSDFADRILNKRETHLCNSLLKENTIEFLDDVISFLFPHFSRKRYFSAEDVLAKLQLIERNLISLLKNVVEKDNSELKEKAEKFMTQIPEIHDKLWMDAEEIYQGDPAAESVDEVILAYPGFMAITIYRIAHEIYKQDIPIIPRVITERAHEITGIDIHPGAEIDSPFFIDHGTGVVIGETTKIGKHVKLYQGVTLGALSVDKSLTDKKRHPTIEDDVIIYSQAVILGGSTTIGKNSIIGGNSWITQSVAPNSIISSKMEVRVRSTDKHFDTIDYII
jgi:serine O-acetyltransferase